MTKQEEHDLLIRMDLKLSILCQRFKEAENKGFLRCATHAADITNLQTWRDSVNRILVGVAVFIFTIGVYAAGTAFITP